MYIKMSFLEANVVIPQTWNGLIVGFPEGIQPGIVERLPADTAANQPVNIKDFDSENATDDVISADSTSTQEYIGKTYDYYYDCHELNIDVVKKGLEIFLADYAGNIDAKLADDRYPEVHPAIELLEQSLTKAACLLSPKLSKSVHRFINTLQESSMEKNKLEYLPPSTGF